MDPSTPTPLLGLAPLLATALVIVAGAVGAHVGTGLGAALAMAAVIAAGLVSVALLGVVVGRRRRAADLAAEWARIEPTWSGRT